MNCPKDGSPLESVEIGPLSVDRCPKCGGSWTGIEELRLLKDREAVGDYSWIDFDLWKDRDKFRAHRQQRYQCPRDGQPMTTVRYGDSSVTVDICGECKGAWLDKKEFDEILAYLEDTVTSQTVGDLLKELRHEFVEIFTGPEDPISEAGDFIRVLSLLERRFAVEHPNIVAWIPRL